MKVIIDDDTVAACHIIEHASDYTTGEEVVHLGCPECGEPAIVRIDGYDLFRLTQSMLRIRAHEACEPCQIAAGWDAYPRDF